MARFSGTPPKLELTVAPPFEQYYGVEVSNASLEEAKKMVEARLDWEIREGETRSCLKLEMEHGRARINCKRWGRFQP
jgi:hypothetical protein